jgi:pimeloyl-ACP methyl ester carboxylesterase
MRLVDLAGTTLAVHEWGDEDAPAILFWHALGPDPSGIDLDGVARRLVAAGHRVLAVDGPGFGASPLLPAEGYELRTLAGLVRRLVATLDLEPVVVMGHSWGGAVMVTYAAAHPGLVRAIVLLDSGHIDYADLPDVDVDRTAEDFVADVRARDGTRADARGRAMRGLTERVSGTWPPIAQHRIPTLLFLATSPPHVEQNRAHIARFEAAMPQADIRWAPNAGHGLLADVGPPLGDQVAEWLRGLRD